ncbi:MAG: NADPH-dependent F420 reductase, partial [Halobacteriaceae archaeon]
MRVALLGGTGDIGEGLSLRLAFHTDHEIIVGSRDRGRAREKAKEYRNELHSLGEDGSITGTINPEAAKGADIVIAAVPPYHIRDTVVDLLDEIRGSILVSPAVGMTHDDDGAHYNPPDDGSVTELIASTVPDDVPVVGAYHNLSADRLANLEAELNIDVLLVGDDADAKRAVSLLTSDIEGLRPLDAGQLTNAHEVESLTPLLINLAANNDGLENVGV